MKHLSVIVSIGLLVLLSPLAVSAQCYGDFNCDGTVDGSDLAKFADSFGSTSCAMWLGEITGTVQCTDGSPAAGVMVYVPGDSFVSITGDSGWYKIRAVPEGTYTLIVRVAGREEAREVDVAVIGEEVTEVHFAIDVCGQEICDGIDNDLDGKIDEDLTGPDCPEQDGVCAGARAICGGINGWLPCNYMAYSANYEPFEVSCDGLDNDCDGVVDGMTQICGPDGGACVPGFQTCSNGEYGICEGGVGPTDEVCDQIDNDCDGETDEGVLCDDGVACTIDSCSSGECTFTPDDAFCDDGLACTTNSCDIDGCANAIIADACAINGACYSNNDPNPANDCLLCDSGADPYSWTMRPNGSSCSSGTCSNGVCQ